MLRAILVLAAICASCGKTEDCESEESDTEGCPKEAAESSPVEDSPNDSDSPASGDEKPEYVLPNGEPQTWEGESGKLIDGIELFAGAVAFKVENEADRHMSVTLHKGEKQLDLLANGSDPYVQHEFIKAPEDGSDYMLEIKAHGSWQITTIAPELADEIPTSLDGDGSMISKAFWVDRQQLKLKTDFSGDRHFSVTSFNAMTGEYEDLHFNKSEPFKGESLFAPEKPGYYLFHVNAKEPWSLEMTEIE